MTLKRNTKEITNIGQFHIRKKTLESQNKLLRRAEKFPSTSDIHILNQKGSTSE